MKPKLRGNLNKDQYDDENVGGGLISKRQQIAGVMDRHDHYHNVLDYGTIDRFLMGNIGRPWDRVRTEAIKKFNDPCGFLRQHLDWKVDRNVYVDVNDKLAYPLHARNGCRWAVLGFYEDPKTGQLCHQRSKRDLRYRDTTPHAIRTLGFVDKYDLVREFVYQPQDWYLPNGDTLSKVKYGNQFVVWECRNGAWLIHEFTRRDPNEIIGYYTPLVISDPTQASVPITRKGQGYPEWERKTRSASHKEIARMKKQRLSAA